MEPFMRVLEILRSTEAVAEALISDQFEATSHHMPTWVLPVMAIPIVATFCKAFFTLMRTRPKDVRSEASVYALVGFWMVTQQDNIF